MAHNYYHRTRGNLALLSMLTVCLFTQTFLRHFSGVTYATKTVPCLARDAHKTLWPSFVNEIDLQRNTFLSFAFLSTSLHYAICFAHFSSRATINDKWWTEIDARKEFIALLKRGRSKGVDWKHKWGESAKRVDKQKNKHRFWKVS